MTREQQKKLKLLKQSLPKIIQYEIKKYKLKKKDFMVWYNKKDIFFSLLISITEVDGHCYCSSRETIKPLWLDELFWDIMNMSENKSEPLSMRSIGAFTVHGVDIFEDKKELVEWKNEELEKYTIDYIAHFNNVVKNTDVASYYSLLNQSIYHRNIQEILVLIHECKYQEALIYLQSMEGDGYFSNEGVSFKEYAEIYCKEHL